MVTDGSWPRPPHVILQTHESFPLPSTQGHRPTPTQTRPLAHWWRWPRVQCPDCARSPGTALGPLSCPIGEERPHPAVEGAAPSPGGSGSPSSGPEGSTPSPERPAGPPASGSLRDGAAPPPGLCPGPSRELECKTLPWAHLKRARPGAPRCCPPDLGPRRRALDSPEGSSAAGPHS